MNSYGNKALSNFVMVQSEKLKRPIKGHSNFHHVEMAGLNPRPKFFQDDIY